MQAMGIQRYMFFSIHNCDKHPEVPLMQMKTCTEQYLKESGLNYTIFRLCGFMQASACCTALKQYCTTLHTNATCCWMMHECMRLSTDWQDQIFRGVIHLSQAGHPCCSRHSSFVDILGVIAALMANNCVWHVLLFAVSLVVEVSLWRTWCWTSRWCHCRRAGFFAHPPRRTASPVYSWCVPIL